MRRSGAALAEDAAERRDPAEALVRLEHAVAFDAAIDLGADAELVEQVHLVPAGDAARRHAGVEQLVGAPQERVERFGGVALLEAAVGELGEIPGRRGTLQGVAQGQPGVPDADLGDDVERPAAGEPDGQLRERLEAAAEARRRPADALGDRLELAAGGRDQRQDAVGLAQVEARQDDRFGGVAARDRASQRDGITASWTGSSGRPLARTSGRRRCGRVPRAGVVVLGAGPRQHAAAPTGYRRRARFVYTGATMTTALPDLDLAELIADTEAEIVRLVRDRDPSTARRSTRWSATTSALDGSGANGGKRMRPLLGLLAYASIAGDHRAALPGAAAVELGHNFSLVHDDIEDGDRERRHRPTLWTRHGVPQAINTGDTLFSLSPHRAPPADRPRLLATPRSCA